MKNIRPTNEEILVINQGYTLLGYIERVMNL